MKCATSTLALFHAGNDVVFYIPWLSDMAGKSVGKASKSDKFGVPGVTSHE